PFLKKNTKGYGIPQGNPMSGTLANLFLLDFDTTMKELVADQLGGVYRRYSDDIFILVPLGEAKGLYETVCRILKVEGLKLGAAKTEAFRRQNGQKRIQNITSEIEPRSDSKREEAQYLGLHFNGEQITVRSGTLARHLRFKEDMKDIRYLKSVRKKTQSAAVDQQVSRIRHHAKWKSSWKD
ncbi:MAG TPA: reverse transcriptase domain-containing protein, partial [Candidatus Saccharimonadales bacterium]|nr:reverse transcriptase domain-containing protein [Candidatus Saccharimonadales bacterium]